MTKEEAVKELELIAHITMWNDRREAVEMAIEALQNEDREDYELATEQMEHDAMYEPTYNSEDGSM